MTFKADTHSYYFIFKIEIFLLGPPLMNQVFRSVMHEAALLGDKIKALEKSFSQSLPAGLPYVVRLDGVSFKKFTQPMAKPFDPRFTLAMSLTARDLLERSSARTAFCQSDEITLVFAGEPLQNQIMYSGRTDKIVSVLASIASARFNDHIKNIQDDQWLQSPGISDLKALSKIKDGNAFFDARVFSVPDESTAAEVVQWRHKFDCRRNVVNSVGFHVLGHKQMQDQPIGSVLEWLREQHGIDPFRDYPAVAMLGVFMKKIQYESTGYNPKTCKNVPCLRSKVEARTFDWESTDTQQAAEMILSKFWRPSDPPSLQPIDLLE